VATTTAAASGTDEAAASPRLALTDLDGTPRDLPALRGRIVVVNYWATWCLPCRDEMPMLARVARAYRERGVVVVGASADTPETRGAIPPLLRDADVDFPIWVGATTLDMERMDVGAVLPATAILDADGRIAYRVIGPLTENDLRVRLDALLLGTHDGPAPSARLVRSATAEDDGGDDHDRDHAEHDHAHGDEHAHGDDEDHAHGAVALEGASLVPS